MRLAKADELRAPQSPELSNLGRTWHKAKLECPVVFCFSQGFCGVALDLPTETTVGFRTEIRLLLPPESWG